MKLGEALNRRAELQTRLGEIRDRLRLTALVSSSLPPIETETTLGRELIFVLSHTIHHNSLIAVMAKTLGVVIPDRFGYAPSTLAHHWEEAGDLERAIGFYVAAAEQASRGWAKEEAVDLLRRALSLVQQDDRERFRKLRLKLFVAEQMLYHVPDAQALARDRTSEPQD